ncbi:hypothetical protein E8M01_33695 [Phreatobacter stygius]|uniref:Uncharacterized protein n=1 Tax=Phreatobacter stygius TaxID=1940610 RepID=A0A4D7BE27_9HYPH|nr:hypothetical protein E8M01_33695 [Phreatobacter stygius]
MIGMSCRKSGKLGPSVGGAPVSWARPAGPRPGPAVAAAAWHWSPRRPAAAPPGSGRSRQG